ncbi:MAG: hypothetical protein KQI35_18155 [Bacteroidetes bacterium]|nr:hypothetical protein [Bacteroidota bacterium]
MPNKIKEPYIFCEILNQKPFERTILVVNCHVPAGFTVKLQKKTTKYGKTEAQKEATDQIFNKLTQVENHRKKERHDEEFDLLPDQIKNDPNIKYESTFYFQVITSNYPNNRYQYFKYMLPDENHNVKVNFSFSETIQKDAKLIPKLEKIIKGLVPDYSKDDDLDLSRLFDIPELSKKLK